MKFTRLGARWLPDVEREAKQAFTGHWLGQTWLHFGFASTHFYESQDIPALLGFSFKKKYIRLNQIKVHKHAS